MGGFYLYIWVFLDLSLGDFNLAHLVFLIISENLDQRNAHVFCKVPSPKFRRKETSVELPFSYHLLTFRNKTKCEMFLKFLDMMINYSYRLYYLLLCTWIYSKICYPIAYSNIWCYWQFIDSWTYLEWAELVSPQRRYVEVLTARTSECAFIRKQGLCRFNQVEVISVTP